VVITNVYCYNLKELDKHIANQWNHSNNMEVTGNQFIGTSDDIKVYFNLCQLYGSTIPIATV